MRKFDDKEILDSVERLPTFKGWKKGEYDIWVRSSADAFDQFDDKAFTYHCSADGERPAFFMSRSGTTNAGSYGLKHFDEYNHEGCAVLKADVIVYGSHIYGLHHGKPAYRQSRSWPYYRDNNHNNRAEEIGTVHSGVIGANIHRAGVNSTVINNWSTACLVTANLAKFLAFLAYMKSQGNPPLNVAILNESTISAAASTGRGLAGPGADESSSVEIPAGSPSGSDEQPPTDTVVVEKEENLPLWKKLWKNFTAWVAGIGGTAKLQEYHDQFQQIGIPATIIRYALYAAVVGFLIWLIYECVYHVYDKYFKRQLTLALIAANSTPTNKVEVANSDNLASLERQGYTVVRRK